MKLSRPAPTNPEPSISSSHLSHSFCRQFSQKILVPESEMTHFQTSRVCLSTSGTNGNDPQSPENKGISCNATVKSCSPTQLISISPSHILSLSSSEVRSVKPILTQDKSFIVTPAQSIPKRALLSPDDGNLSFETESCKAKRSLSFQDQNRSKVSVCVTEANREVDDCGHQKIETQKILVGEETPRYMYTHLQEDCLELQAKEIETGLKNNEGFQETGLVKRQQMLAYLPELFYTVRHVFQSTKCSVITKQELIHKILFHNCNIEETREAEELLGLLEELVPDWICGQTVSTGDFLYRIQKTCDPESIRVRLVDAII
ncbi:CDT1-like protein b [Acorus calamus]|uniref:CDT1-like protein b n=1 Tax=Acorus calamus TaxID=4465 RepID=A0AAV9DRD4_ACOCL|nr:CDT1-like protein b [Acorus calamus]